MHTDVQYPTPEAEVDDVANQVNTLWANLGEAQYTLREALQTVPSRSALYACYYSLEMKTADVMNAYDPTVRLSQQLVADVQYGVLGSNYYDQFQTVKRQLADWSIDYPNIVEIYEAKCPNGPIDP